MLRHLPEDSCALFLKGILIINREEHKYKDDYDV